MKKYLFITVLLTVLSTIKVNAFSTKGYDISVINSDGVRIYYRWTNNKTELSVSYIEEYNGYYSDYSGNVNIPAFVEYEGNTYIVTSINFYAFYKCKNLTSVTIPSSVKTIGNNAFEYSSISSVTIPSSVKDIGNNAFNGCTNLSSLNIPSSVTSIGSNAFMYTDWYKNQYDGLLYLDNWLIGYKGEQPSGNLNIKEGTRGIASSALKNCSSLTSLTFPNSITAIGSSAFSKCSGLTSLTIPSSVTNIGSYAFYKCTGLTALTIPNGVTSIGGGAFGGCTGLTALTIPNSVTYIGSEAFDGCTGLTELTIPNSITKLYGFSGCTGLTSLTIPSSVTTIGKNAFSGCIGLTSVNIPSSVTTIEDNAFKDCTSLNSLTLPNSISTLSGFSGCTGLTSVTIPSSVTTISDNAFYDCKGLTSLTLSSVNSIGKNAFYGCSGLTSINLPSSLNNIGSTAFGNCTELSTVTIQSNIESKWDIYNYEVPFYNCLKLKEMIFDCEKITSCIAYKITSLETLSFSESVKEIGNNAFYGCSGIKSITIPSSVNTIGDYAFSGCSLSSVTIPSSVTNFGKCVFQECTELLTVKSYMTEPNTIVYNDGFTSKTGFSENTYRNGTLYVPAGTKELYIRFDGWKEFLKIVEMAGEEQTYLTILNGDEEVAKLKVKQGEGYTWKIPSTDDHKLTSLYFNDALVTNQLTQDGFYTTPAITTSSILKMIYEDSAKKRGDVNRDGDVNVADHVELTKIIMEQE